MPASVSSAANEMTSSERTEKLMCLPRSARTKAVNDAQADESVNSTAWTVELHLPADVMYYNKCIMWQWQAVHSDSPAPLHHPSS